MKNKITALLIAIVISVTTYAAAVWVGSQYLETFQNGIMFGNFQILKVSNGVPEFEDASGNEKRLDDADKDIFFQEDFEGAAVSFTCDANIAAADDTGLMGSATSKSFTQSTGAQDEVCSSANIPFAGAQEAKLCLVSSGSANFDLKVYDVTNSTYLGTAPLRGNSNQDCVWFEGERSTANIRYDLVVRIEENADELIIDNVQAEYFPHETGDIYASSEWEEFTPDLSTFGTVTNVDFEKRRDGTDLIIRGSATSGTVSASECRLGLPDGLLTKGTSLGSIKAAPSFFRGVNDTNISNILIEPNVNYINFGRQGGGSASLNKLNCNGLVGNTENFSLYARVPIAGWTNTKKSVTVKNTTSSDIASENTFSARIDGSGNIVSENVDWVDGNCTAGASSHTCTFNSGVFSVAPSCTATNEDGNSVLATIPSVSTSEITIARRVSTTASNSFSPFTIICHRQGSDFVKERDRVYTFAADSLTGNSCGLEGNDGRAITANTESIPFDGSCLGWTSGADGATTTNGNYYEVQNNNSIVDITLNAAFSSNAARNYYLYVNGSQYRSTHSHEAGGTVSASKHGGYRSYRGEFSAGDKIAFVSTASGGTLSNNSALHYLNISEEYGDRGTFVGQWGYESCYVKQVLSSGTNGGDLTSSTWTDRVMNTKEGSCSFLSLSNGTTGTDGNNTEMTLQTGVYNVECVAPARSVDSHKIKILNVTDTVDEIIGSDGYADTSVALNNPTFLRGQLVVGSEKDYKLQHWVSTTQTLSGQGVGASSGDDNTFAQCKFTKVR